MAREFVPTSDGIWDRVSKVLLADYPQMCICWIERIGNPAVRAAYDARRLAMEAAAASTGGVPPTERVLFHGTKADRIDAIVRDGFKVALNRVSAYGIGTYFATSAALSAHYTDVSSRDEMSYMFVCRVLIGRIATGQTRNGILDTAQFDNTSNGGANPTIFTTPTDDRAFPEYLVAFYKKA